MNERTNKCVYFNRDILLMKSTVGHKCIAFTAAGNKRYKILFMSEKHWLNWFCEAGGGSPDEARLEQTPYPFQPH